MLETVLRNPWVRAVGAVVCCCSPAAFTAAAHPHVLVFSFLVAYVLTPVVNFGARCVFPVW